MNVILLNNTAIVNTITVTLTVSTCKHTNTMAGEIIFTGEQVYA